MAIAVASEKQSRNKCIICTGTLEKANLGSMCNPCKDKIMKPAAG